MFLCEGDRTTIEHVQVRHIPQFEEPLGGEGRRCYIHLDLENGALYGCTRKMGNVPLHVATGIVLEWPVSAMSGPKVDRLLSIIAESAQTILDNAEVTVEAKYNGRILPGPGGIAYDHISLTCDTLG